MLIDSSNLRKLKASTGFNITIGINVNTETEEFAVSLVDDGKKIFCKSNNNEFKFDSDMKLKNDFIYILEDGELEKVMLFDDYDRPYFLKPTQNYPDLMLYSKLLYNGNPKKLMEYYLAALKKEISSSKNVLITFFGLGYLTNELLKLEMNVCAYQREKEVIDLSKLNPYTKSLFDSLNFEIKNLDLFENSSELENDSFDLIVLNTPLSYGQNYASKHFFNELFRVLKTNSKLFVFDYNENFIKKLTENGFNVIQKETYLICIKK